MTASASGGALPGRPVSDDRDTPAVPHDTGHTAPDAVPPGGAGGGPDDVGRTVGSSDGWERETHAPVAQHGDHDYVLHETNTGISNPKLAMWAFLGSECLLFGALIATYFLYRTRSQGMLIPHDVYDIPFTSVSSFILLTSSLTMVMAVLSLKHDKIRQTVIWLVATALLGATFLAGQVYEFTEFVAKGVTMSSNPASSAFYTLTGFHGAHVGIGVLLLSLMVALVSMGKIKTRQHEVVEIVGLYWHFVDVVWIVVFTIVYLLPLPGR